MSIVWQTRTVVDHIVPFIYIMRIYFLDKYSPSSTTSLLHQVKRWKKLVFNHQKIFRNGVDLNNRTTTGMNRHELNYWHVRILLTCPEHSNLMSLIYHPFAQSALFILLHAYRIHLCMFRKLHFKASNCYLLGKRITSEEIMAKHSRNCKEILFCVPR